MPDLRHERSLTSRIGAVAAALAATFAASGAQAEPSATLDDECRHLGSVGDCLVVLVDHIRRVELERAAKTVLIGNPAVADVSMVSQSLAVVTARTVGATNLIFLDEDGETISDYEVVVRETEQIRVVLRRGPRSTELYQCAPRCERTLTQLDSTDEHADLSARIQSESQLNASAVNQVTDDGSDSADKTE